MPLPTVIMPTSWNVPSMPGVPSLLGQRALTGAEATISVDLGNWLTNLQINQIASEWGIFDSSGSQVLSAASVRSVSYESAYRISDAPLEQGSFTSYNKVKVPYTAVVELICDGSRGVTLPAFLYILQSLTSDTAIYSVYTPDITYRSANIVGHRYRREARRGLNMIVAEILLREVRQAPTGQYLSKPTATPAGAANQNLGTVQPQAATAQQSQSLQGPYL